MRKMIFLTCIILSACAINPYYTTELNSNFKTPVEIQTYVYENLNYLVDTESIYEQFEYWQSPLETENLKTGDCEDYTLLFMYLCYTELEIKPLWVTIKTAVEYHAIAKIDDTFYDATENQQMLTLPGSWKVLLYT